MISKAESIKRKIVADIGNGRLGAGLPIPSRHQYMQQFSCARGTIDAAINDLKNSGYLYSVRGGGTYVAASLPEKRIRKICIIDNSDMSDIIESGLRTSSLAGECRSTMPTEIYKVSDVYTKIGELARPGNGLVWVRPSYDFFLAMNYVADMGIPQLLLARTFGNFDFITTDAKKGISKGIAELRKHSDKIAFVSERNNPELPYIAERQIAFYQVCVEQKLNLHQEWIFDFDRTSFTSEISRIGQQLFCAEKTPEAIFLTNSSMAIPLLTYAEAHGKTPGDNLTILIFDKENNLIGRKGIIMLRQMWKQMAFLVEEWVKQKNLDIAKHFHIKIEPELIKLT